MRRARRRNGSQAAAAQRALRAFEAAGQHLSFTAAANSLTVAQSAVSRHVIPRELPWRCAAPSSGARSSWCSWRRAASCQLLQVLRPHRPGARRGDQGERAAELGCSRSRCRPRSRIVSPFQSYAISAPKTPVSSRNRFQAEYRAGSRWRHRHRHRLFRAPRHRCDPRSFMDGALDASVQKVARGYKPCRIARIDPFE